MNQMSKKRKRDKGKVSSLPKRSTTAKQLLSGTEKSSITMENGIRIVDITALGPPKDGGKESPDDEKQVE